MKLRTLMTRDLISVGPDASLKEAARRMVEAGVSGLPVTDSFGHLVGIVSEADFVATEAGRRRERRAGLLRFLFRDTEMPTGERLVRDVMSTELITLGPDADHTEAARVMQRERIKRIPVVEDGRLVGLVSRSDIIRVFARSDLEIIEEINHHIMGDILWIDPRRVTVRCEDGNVELRGRLETKTDADLLGKLVARADGVVSVANRLDWDVDNTRLETVGLPVMVPPRRGM
jgi:CBS domain-containing protein